MPSLAQLIATGAALAVAAAAPKRGYATRYWDCCKSHCAWAANVPQGVAPETTCDRQDKRIFPAEPNRPSSCNDPTGEGAYACHDRHPWAVTDTLSYGFAAAPAVGNVCGKCYRLRFTGEGKYGTKEGARALLGKEMVVQATNIGYDVAGSQFDLMIPGGGVGLFDACTAQWKVSDPGVLGAQYGGFLTLCQGTHGYDDHSALKTCVARKCGEIFGDGKFPKLYDGCMWFVDWFQVADNPTFEAEEVACPAAIVALTGMDRSPTAALPTTRPTARQSTSPTPQPEATPPPSEETPAPTGGGGATCPTKEYGQCGGEGWGGPACCPVGFACRKQNEWYSQCLEATAATPLPSMTQRPTNIRTASPTAAETALPCNPNNGGGLVCESGLTGAFGKWNLCGSGSRKFSERKYCPPGFALCNSGKCTRDESSGCKLGHGGVKIGKARCSVTDSGGDEGSTDEVCKGLSCKGSELCTRRKCSRNRQCAITLIEGKVACRARSAVSIEDMCDALTRRKNKWTRSWCLGERKNCRISRSQRKWRCVSRGTN